MAHDSGVNDSDSDSDDDGLADSPSSKDQAKLVTLTRKEVLETLAVTKNLKDMDIRKANLVKIDFSGCDLRTTNFSYSNLKDANFTGADLRGPLTIASKT